MFYETHLMEQIGGMSSTPKDRWDKVEIAGKLVGVIAVPVVLLLLGNWLTLSLKAGDARARKLELAIKVLEQEPERTSDIPGLREWASATLREDLALSKESSESLLQKRLPVSSTSCCVTCEGATYCGYMVNTPCGSCGPAEELSKLGTPP
jgi:hypothetical protein